MNTTNTPTMLDEIMPSYDVRDVHELWAAAPPEVAYRAVMETTAREVRLFSPLMGLRTLWDRMKGKAPDINSDLPLLEEFARGGFSILAEKSGREITLGAIGRFWRMTDDQLVRGIDTREHSQIFGEGGYAKAALSFRVVPNGSGCRVVTETRVKGTSPDATRRFRIYWTLIKLGSAALRRSWLAAIQRRIDRTASNGL